MDSQTPAGARVIFLSPHFDDAILSCPVQIQRHIAAGDSVTIVTFFSEGNYAGSDELPRAQENENACAILGAEVKDLGFWDAPFRPSYAKRGKRFLFGAIADDQETFGPLTQKRRWRE